MRAFLATGASRKDIGWLLVVFGQQPVGFRHGHAEGVQGSAEGRSLFKRDEHHPVLDFEIRNCVQKNSLTHGNPPKRIDSPQRASLAEVVGRYSEIVADMGEIMSHAFSAERLAA